MKTIQHSRHCRFELAGNLRGAIEKLTKSKLGHESNDPIDVQSSKCQTCENSFNDSKLMLAVIKADNFMSLPNSLQQKTASNRLVFNSTRKTTSKFVLKRH